jgi:hypothetical protein
MRHLLAFENLALITTRQTKDCWGAFVSRLLIGHKAVAAFDINTVFPLYVRRNQPRKKLQLPAGTLMLFEPEPEGAVRVSTPNLDPTFIAEFARRVKLEWQESGPGDLKRTFGPEDVFHYLYAVLHSPAYRERYAEFLKIDFPRLPLPADAAPFLALRGLGRELVALHLLEAPALAGVNAGFPVAGANEVEKSFPKYVPEQQRVHINADQYFADVPPEVWDFRVGGYQVGEKWLKDRRGRSLDFNALTHYRQIVAALAETRRLMAALAAAAGGTAP